MGNGRERARDRKPITDGAKIFQMWNSFYGSAPLAWLTQVLPGKECKQGFLLTSVCNGTKNTLLKLSCVVSFRKMSMFDPRLFFESWPPFQSEVLLECLKVFVWVSEYLHLERHVECVFILLSLVCITERPGRSQHVRMRRSLLCLCSVVRDHLGESS